MTAASSRTVALARRIADLAARRQWRKGRRVTEMELALALGVSRTPVRRAMCILANEGALEPYESRGFCLSKDSRDLAQLNLKAAPGAAERLYALIIKDRIASVLPREVTQAMLAVRYSASRPVLEHTLKRLEADGLLLRGSGRAWRFVDAMSDANSITASYDLRVMLEPSALLLKSARPDVVMLRSLRDRHRNVLELIAQSSRKGRPSRSLQLERLQPVALDADFHNGLASLSGNPFVVATVRHQIDLRRLLEHEVSGNALHVAKWCREHLVVIDALLAGDAMAAAGALRRHLDRARLDALSSFMRLR